MIKNVSKIEHRIGDRSYELMCNIDAPFSEIKEALCHFMKQIGNIEDYARGQELAKKQAEEKQENNEEANDVSVNNQ